MVRYVCLLRDLLINPEVRLTFSGRRFYRVVNQEEEDGWRILTLRPTDFYGAYPAAPDADAEYKQWLVDSNCSDPVFDRQLLERYKLTAVDERDRLKEAFVRVGSHMIVGPDHRLLVQDAV